MTTLGLDGTVAETRGQSDRHWPPALGALGRAIERRAVEMMERVTLTIRGAAKLESYPFEELLLGDTIAATRAFGTWIATGDPSDSRAAGRAACDTFGRVVAADGVTTTDMVRRCQLWRDVIAEALETEARRLRTPATARAKAQAMLQRSLDVTLVQFAVAFDAERHRLRQELQLREDQLLHQATHDALTGLPNRSLILARLDALLARPSRRPRTVAVLFVDLDGFKAINDTLGHALGDQLLIAASRRMRRVLRISDTLGRIGGDEFVVVTERLGSHADLEAITRRLIVALRTPFRLAPRQQATISASIGIATGSHSAATLLRDADAAMYQAKARGKNQFAVTGSHSLAA